VQRHVMLPRRLSPDGGGRRGVVVRGRLFSS
jgi:hypothetical protein